MGGWTSKPEAAALHDVDPLCIAETDGHECQTESKSSNGSEQVAGESGDSKANGSDDEEQNTDDADNEDTFYKFVILHAQNDTDEALRLLNLLENKFQVIPGRLFNDMPAGNQQLQNLSDAVNGSAWTILLLTEDFLSEAWCKFQSYITLMNSLNKQHKYNTVIPVRILNNPLPHKMTPLVIQAINALEEGNPAFDRQVNLTFQDSTYEQQRTIWHRERKLKQQGISAFNGNKTNKSRAEEG
ncbi:TIR domain-containing adapter molecule 2 [Callorhinchus milii]|uniref:TIR domain-containing adapter molecule 2 n=1 Tax=Callorhinchus milii TaxID=7868 RepID=V9NEN6_CALMI|nr:TIR domain-containing adapter molecule 2 [Callorhinchus milii]AGN91176.1 TIR domain-containing adapter molecule 2 [Callorhinchus milii]|eukprot:gi/632959344/ref/XP_007895568.1/ PREDICTED: TIR domain-containing adapter molecule 2 [Callorhinchus milii]